MADLNQIAQHGSALKHTADAGALVVTVGAVSDMLPAVAATLSILWTVIRIYETETVQKLLKVKK